MASSLLDVCRFNPAAGGTTDWTYSSAVTGYQSPTAAGAVNGAVYSYRAESNDLTQWETGYGAYNSGTGVFARTTVLFNSAGTTAKINFATVPQVAIVALGEDLLSFNSAMSLTAGQQSQGRANLGVEKRNYVVNGAMMVSQENGSTAQTVSQSYPVDQWHVFNNTAATFSVAQVASASPAGSPNRLRVTATSTTSPSGNNFVVVRQKLEGYRVADLMFGSASAKTVTIQLGCKAPAGTYGVSIYNGAVNRSYAGQIVIAGGEANTDVVKTVTILGDTTGTWAKDNTVGMFLDIVLQSSGTSQIAPNAWTVPTGYFTNAQSNFFTNGNVFELFDVGLYEGTAAPAFIVPAFQAALIECRRYYEKSYDYANPPGSNIIPGGGIGAVVPSNTVANQQDASAIPFQVSKRAAPTMTIYGLSGTSGTVSNQGGTDQAAGTGFAIGISENRFGVRNNAGSSYSTTGFVIYFHFVANARL